MFGATAVRLPDKTPLHYQAHLIFSLKKEECMNHATFL